MGILKHLLFWPVTGPTFLARFSIEKVQDAVRQEVTDDQRIKEELLALQMELELGEIDDEEYLRREAELMQRLREVREWREQFGMGVGGGPVRVAPSAATEPAEEEEPPSQAPGRGGIAAAEGAVVELDLSEDAEQV